MKKSVHEMCRYARNEDWKQVERICNRMSWNQEICEGIKRILQQLVSGAQNGEIAKNIVDVLLENMYREKERAKKYGVIIMLTYIMFEARDRVTCLAILYDVLKKIIYNDECDGYYGKDALDTFWEIVISEEEIPIEPPYVKEYENVFVSELKIRRYGNKAEEIAEEMPEEKMNLVGEEPIFEEDEKEIKIDCEVKKIQKVYLIIGCIFLTMASLLIGIVVGKMNVRQKVEKLTVQNEQLLADNEQLLADNEQLTVDNEQLIADNEELQSQIEKLKKKNKNLKEKFAAAEEELEALRSELESKAETGVPAVDETATGEIVIEKPYNLPEEVNLYTEKDETKDIIQTILKDETIVPLVDEGDGWYWIKYQDNIEGYVKLK